ncbi:unnamed protein product [Anisakis simplex]|uniref:SSD domain-containing protein n=1 Tax=Anisakis simplex TaxID=6269 RepID=A0A0M3JU17_ANISI|nr:unnamed protein product [Anisakis simplex]
MRSSRSTSSSSTLNAFATEWIAKMFYRIGYHIGRQPTAYLVACLLITALIACGNIYAKESSSTKDFVPTDAQSLVEIREAERFFGVDGGQIFRINVLAFAADNGSLTRTDVALQLIDFVETSTGEIRIFDDTIRYSNNNADGDDFDSNDEDDSGVFLLDDKMNFFLSTSDQKLNGTMNRSKTMDDTLAIERLSSSSFHTFRDFCEPYCDTNAALTIALKASIVGRDPLEYPISHVFGTEINIANNVFNIDFNETTGYIDSFRKAMLVYLLVLPPGDNSFGLKWEQALNLNAKNYEKLKLMIWSNALLEREAKEVAKRTAPSIIITIALLGAFFVLTSFREEPIQSKPWESLCEMVIPLLGLVTTFGMLSFLGIQYQSILVATLFLVLAVCTDDGFIMLRAWDSALHGEPGLMKVKNSCIDLANVGHLCELISVERRTAIMLKTSGPAITITTLTNALSFSIGIFSRTPAIQTFCLYTTVAVLACFVYQVILYSAILAFSAHRENSRRRAFLCCFRSDKPKRRQWIVELNKFYNRLVDMWVNVVVWKYTKWILSVALIAYWCTSVYGMTKMRYDLTADKLALPDSEFIVYQREQDQAWTEMQLLTVLVTKPGNLLKGSEMRKLKNLLDDFENASFSYGHSSTLFWLPSYMDFIAEISDGFTYTELPDFLDTAGFKHWRPLLRLNETACINNQPECIQEYAFMTGFTSVTHFYDRVPLLNEWRQIASKYADLGILPYNDVNAFVDLSAKTRSTVLSSALASFVCISIACFIVIPHLTTVFIAVLTVISINIGVFGFLALIGVDLDPLSMASLLMAVGFSVDYTAHIGYHYCRIDTNVSRVLITN